MSKQLRLFFDKVLDEEDKKREILESIKDALENSSAYQKAKEVYDKAKEELNKIAAGIKVDFEKDIELVEELKNEIKNDKQCLTDEALNLFIKSKPAIIEKDGKKYEPVFSVKYKLIK